MDAQKKKSPVGLFFFCASIASKLLCLCVESNAGAMFCEYAKPLGGAQRNLFDEKDLLAGDSRMILVLKNPYFIRVLA
jgi:hypothetical protein